MSVHQLDGAPRHDIEHTPLGRFAYELRQYMCSGPEAVMLRSDMKSKIYAAYAGLDPNTEARSLTMYKSWVDELATREYADELVVVACALEFDVRIVVIPHTPSGRPQKWKTTFYKRPDTQPHDERTVFLGNNDVHYMLLARN